MRGVRCARSTAGPGRSRGRSSTDPATTPRSVAEPASDAAWATALRPNSAPSAGVYVGASWQTRESLGLRPALKESGDSCMEVPTIMAAMAALLSWRNMQRQECFSVSAAYCANAVDTLQ